MPHKDRKTRLRYLDKYRETHRPAPVAEAQMDTTLPARGAIVFSADGAQVQCHSCGLWFGSLNAHFKAHGLDARSYKELYDIARGASLWPQALKDKQCQAALGRDQGAVGRAHIPPATGRPKGLQQRLSVRIDASTSRAGVNTRAGDKAKSTK